MLREGFDHRAPFVPIFRRRDVHFVPERVQRVWIGGQLFGHEADLDEGTHAELQQAGAWVFATGLQPPDAAAVLRPRDGEVLTTDGPFAEGKEHLGGFTIVDVPDRDAALGWGRKLSQATGLPIEVRPFHDEAPDVGPE